MDRRVVITGMGVVSALGFGKEEFWTNISQGKSGKKQVKSFNISKYKTQYAVEIDRMRLEREFTNSEEDISIKMSKIAVREALADSKLDLQEINPDNVGMVLGTSLGGLTNGLEFYKSYINKLPYKNEWISGVPTQNVVNKLMGEYQLGGPATVIVTACASGANSISYGYDLIKSGSADVVITGGVDPVCEISYSGFNALRSMAEEECRPFDAERDGILLGEGAAILILENLKQAQARNAQIYTEVIGYGLANDAYHLTSPHPEGLGAIKAMKDAINMGNLYPDDIDYINAHGTGTPLNDKMETLAIKKVFGDHAKKVAISSTKSMIGHNLGAAGSMEAIVSNLALIYNLVPPTINLKNPDLACDLNYTPNQVVERKLKYALSNSFAFAGHCCSLLFQKWGEGCE